MIGVWGLWLLQDISLERLRTTVKFLLDRPNEMMNLKIRRGDEGR